MEGVEIESSMPLFSLHGCWLGKAEKTGKETAKDLLTSLACWGYLW